MLPLLVHNGPHCPMKSRGCEMTLRKTMNTRMRHFAVVMASCAIATGVWTSAVHAGASGDGSVNDSIISAEVRFDSPPADSPCVWEPVSGVGPVTVTTPSGTHTETLVYKACDDRILSYHWIRHDGPARVAETAHQRVSRAVNMLAFRTAPAMNNMVVNVGTWFWVPKSMWKPIRVTAWISTPMGPITVTTTARPHVLTYSPGDGNPPASCVGPGTAWSRRMRDTSSTDCMYTYRSASHTRRSGLYNARAGITWKVSWRSSLGIGGPLPSITTRVPLTARVNEVQVLLR